MILLSLLYVSASFWRQREQGWHWYGRETLTEDNKTPREQIKTLKKQLDESLAKAILEPTRKNIKAYQVLQKKIIDQSQKFAAVWARSVLNNPALDETIKSPVSFYGAQVAYTLKQQNKEKRIRALSKDFGLFFFFKGDCPYCERFADIVSHFSQKYAWKVMAISVDGSTLKQFPDAVRDNGIVDLWGVAYAPSLYMVNPKEEKVVAISHGMSALDTIEDNIMRQIEEEK